MRRLALPLLSSLVLLAACATQEPLDVAENDRPMVNEGAPSLETGTDGFTPIRPATITVPGNGTWVCTPAGAGMVSQCVRRGENVGNVAAAPAENGRVQSILETVRSNTDTYTE